MMRVDQKNGIQNEDSWIFERHTFYYTKAYTRVGWKATL